MSQETVHRTTPPDAGERELHRAGADRGPRSDARPATPWSVTGLRHLALARGPVTAIGLVLLVVTLALLWGQPVVDDPALGMTGDGRTTLVVFACAVFAWACTRIDDTFVALAAGTVLTMTGVMSSGDLFSPLGDDIVWLLVSACIVAAGVTRSGLAGRAAAWIVTGARTPRQLVHLLTAALVVTAFALPSTSGRAALALPVFVAVARVLRQDQERDQEAAGRLTKALALLFPTVILLSAVGSLIGAGAHLITSMLVADVTGEGFSFARWLLLGLPLALVTSHVAAEIVLATVTCRSDRSQRLRITVEDVRRVSDTRVTGPLGVAESRAALLLAGVVVLWCSESLHGIDPAVVALLGALVVTSPRYGLLSLKQALPTVPWSMLLFMAATLALGQTLSSTGAAAYLARQAFSVVPTTSPTAFVLAVIVVSTLAHLVIQSRSARSAVLVPIVVALAPATGTDVAAAAFASTAAAGFCHTLTSSAKPVALFSDVEGVPTYDASDLRRLSLWLMPVHVALVAAFSLVVWPALGLSLT